MRRTLPLLLALALVLVGVATLAPPVPAASAHAAGTGDARTGPTADVDHAATAASDPVAPAGTSGPVVHDANVEVVPYVTGLAASPDGGDGDYPVAMRFAPDGRLFVAKKAGRVDVFDGPGEPARQSIDLRDIVHDWGDRGLLGLEVDPQFNVAGGSHRYVYILYVYDNDPLAPTGGARWNPNSKGGDNCPADTQTDPQTGSTGVTRGCPAGARLSRYHVDALGVKDQAEQVLIQSSSTDGWCFQFWTHSVGTLRFGPDGALYVSAGEGAGFTAADVGQYPATGNADVPRNPCGDSPTTRGTSPATNLATIGGALRAQAVRSPNVRWLDGAILRVNKDTGAALANNPLVGSTVPTFAQRIVAYGLRNPFRFTFRPGTNELWLGDVGYNTWEEVDRFTTGPGQTQVPNFGWPCEEGGSSGSRPEPEYDAADKTICEDLYTSATPPIGGSVTSPLVAPYFSYRHQDPVDGATCTTTGGSSVSSVAFPTAAALEAHLGQGSLVFGDYARGCIWVMPAGGNGLPDPAHVTALVTGTNPVDMETDANGNLYWVDIAAGAVYQLCGQGQCAPIATFTSTPDTALDPSGHTLALSADDATAGTTYAWDFGGGATATGPAVTHTFASSPATVTLTVTRAGLTNTVVRSIPIGPPPVISGFVVNGGQPWTVAQAVTYSAAATDPAGGGAVPGTSFQWEVLLHHCADDSGASGCHVHFNTVGALPHATAGSFVAPDHEFYAELEVKLTVTGSNGVTSSATVVAKPAIVLLQLGSQPAGASISAGTTTQAAPFTTKVLGGSPTVLVAPATFAGQPFLKWSDGVTDPQRTISAAGGIVALSALYTLAAGPPPATPTVPTPLAPTRLLDTRPDATPGGPIGYRGPKPGQGGEVDLAVAGRGGVPADAAAVVLNVTATNATDAGFVTVWPGGPRPLASNLNVERPAETIANLVTVPLGADGHVHLFTQRGADLIADVAAWLPASGGFHPLTPTRLLDTRPDASTAGPLGYAGAKPGQGGTVTLAVRGHAGIPAAATAVVLNVTATDATDAGFVTVWPTGQPRPTASSLNVERVGQTIPNQVIVPIGADGTVSLFTQRGTHFVVDASGWFGAGSYQPVTPTRVLDTRPDATPSGPLGYSGAKPGQGGIVEVPLASRAGVAAGARIAVVNVTATEATAPGFVTVWPSDQVRPNASNLNLEQPGQTIANAVVVGLSPSGGFSLFTQRGTHLVVDVVGWSS